MSAAKRTIVVTGAAKGIGHACAERFVAAGDRVVLMDSDAEAGARAQSQLAAKGEALFMQVDVTDVQRVARAFDEAFGLAGRLDAAVNCAGIIKGAPVLDYSPEDFDRVIAVNLKGTFLCAQAAARHMAAQGHGSIVNMSSVNSTVAIPDQVAYCASKGAINQLTRSMAVALAPKGVRVNAVAPGTIMTELARTVLSTPAALTMVKTRTPLGRVGEPSEVASTVYFLAGDEASYITGEIIYIDGGRLALNYTMPA